MKPEIMMLSGIVHHETLKKLIAGERLKQISAYKRITKQLRKELGKNKETDAILEAIKPKI